MSLHYGEGAIYAKINKSVMFKIMSIK